MDPTIASVLHDLSVKDTNPTALTRLIRRKHDYESTVRQMDLAGLGDDAKAFLAELGTLLKGIPSETRCQCCGERIIRVYRSRGSALVGAECAREDELGSCRRRWTG